MSQAGDANELLRDAEGGGEISKETALVVRDIGAEIQAGLGIPASDVEASEVVLVSVMPDDSGSINFAGNTEAVCQGHNLIIDALVGSKSRDAVLLLTRYLNGYVLNPYRPVEQADRMDERNYNPGLGTPLYDQTAVFLGTVLAKTQEFESCGVPVRTISLIITDGADQHSGMGPDMVAHIVRDMLLTEKHIIAAMGISDGQTDFNRVFTEMGIDPKWILTPGNTKSEIREALNVFSQSAVSVSQGAASFSKAAIGGFGG